MDTEKKPSPTPILKNLPANRKWVDRLYAEGHINRKTRDNTLDFLFPNQRWGLLISYLFLILGCALILSGLIYFFAFNWAAIPPLVKLVSIQLGIIICVMAAYFYTLERLSGQLLLLSASVLVGIFMAVYGQIYQTGADVYQLFMMWSVLILAWTMLSNFAMQWLIWLIVTNLFFILYWQQVILPDYSKSPLILAYLGMFNSGFLLLREYLIGYVRFNWLTSNWVRYLLIIYIFILSDIIIIDWMFDGNSKLTIVSIIGLITHAILFVIYRFKQIDLPALSLVILSICIIIEATFIRLLFNTFSGYSILISMAAITIIIFSIAVIYLKETIKKMGKSHV